MNKIQTYLDKCPLIAILRGILPEEATAACNVLVEEGFTIIEVPLNSPNPYESIANIAKAGGDKIICGAGTVIKVEDVDKVAEAGGQIIISPNCNVKVIRRAKELGMLCIPGVATPSEAFEAIEAGADALKLFPAELITPKIMKAMLVVLPSSTILIPVGGVNQSNMKEYVDAGAKGFGLGSSLYKAGRTAEELRITARESLSAMKEL